jgi:hypothetical protein
MRYESYGRRMTDVAVCERTLRHTHIFTFHLYSVFYFNTSVLAEIYKVWSRYSPRGTEKTTRISLPENSDYLPLHHDSRFQRLFFTGRMVGEVFCLFLGLSNDFFNYKGYVASQVRRMSAWGNGKDLEANATFVSITFATYISSVWYSRLGLRCCEVHCTVSTLMSWNSRINSGTPDNYQFQLHLLYKKFHDFMS